MKYLFTALLFLTMQVAWSQKLPASSLNKVRLSLPDKMIVAEIIPFSPGSKTFTERWYWWYGSGVIHMTQGGYEGKVLNGKYEEFYLNKSLMKAGVFKKGLKDGVWKYWREDGALAETTWWENGVQTTGAKAPLWQRLNIFKKNKRDSIPDTTKKPR